MIKAQGSAEEGLVKIYSKSKMISGFFWVWVWVVFNPIMDFDSADGIHI